MAKTKKQSKEINLYQILELNNFKKDFENLKAKIRIGFCNKQL